MRRTFSSLVHFIPRSLCFFHAESAMKYVFVAILSTLAFFAILNPELVRETLTGGSVESSPARSTKPPLARSPHRSKQTRAKSTSRHAGGYTQRNVASASSYSPQRQPDPNWLKGSAEKRARLAGIEGRNAPGLQATRESSPAELHWSMLRNKIVVVYFWSTWCGPCLESIEHNNDIHNLSLIHI